VPYLSASAVVIHYEEALYQVYASLPFTFLQGSKELWTSKCALIRKMFLTFSFHV